MPVFGKVIHFTDTLCNLSCPVYMTRASAARPTGVSIGVIRAEAHIPRNATGISSSRFRKSTGAGQQSGEWGQRLTLEWL